jgi:hypothetical protein
MSNDPRKIEAARHDPAREQKIRQDWIDACEFHPLSNSQVLGQVVDWARKDVSERNLTPVLLLDLDSTLYEVGSRTYRILREWIDSAESRAFAGVRDRLAPLRADQIGYSIPDTFGGLGLSLSDPAIRAARDSAMKFWADRFFTNEYLAYDVAYPGASEFVHQVYDTGAEIIYLTGRDEPGMGKGTRSRLLQDGFPFERDRTHLLLKRAFELDDLEHKSAAAEYVKKTGNLIGSFENEPPNLIALSDLFPAAMHVFVDTIYSDRPATPKAGLYRITGFRD